MGRNFGLAKMQRAQICLALGVQLTKLDNKPNASSANQWKDSVQFSCKVGGGDTAISDLSWNDTCVVETCLVALDVGAYPAILAQGWHHLNRPPWVHTLSRAQICLALGVQLTKLDNKPNASSANQWKDSVQFSCKVGGGDTAISDLSNRIQLYSLQVLWCKARLPSMPA